MENPFDKINESLSSIGMQLAEILKTLKREHISEQDEMGGIEFAAKVLGIKKSTVYQLTSRREIPHSKRLKKLYFSRKELEQWIVDSRRPTVFEYQEEASKQNVKKTK